MTKNSTNNSAETANNRTYRTYKTYKENAGTEAAGRDHRTDAG